MNHINTKVLAGLTAAAILAIGAAVLVSHHRQPAEGSGEVAYALPDLRQQVNDVKSITIVVGNNKTAVTLNNGEQGWSVHERGDYLADNGKLRGLLIKLADTRLLQKKTANTQRYPDLGVEDVKAKDAKGVLLKLEGLSKPAQLIIGNASSHGDGTFVRRPDDPQSWLAQGQIHIDRDPVQWLDTELADIASERIAEIVLSTAQGKTLRLFRDEANGNFQLADLPRGRELAAPDVIGALASTLSRLTLEDVVSREGYSLPEGSHQSKAHYRTFDGVNVEVIAWKQGSKHYASFEASLDQAQADKSIQSEQNKANADYEAQQKTAEKGSKPAEGQEAEIDSASAPLAVKDPVKFRQQRLDEISAEIARLKTRFQERHFMIPEFKYANMDKTIDDVLKPLSEAKKPAVKAKVSK